MKAIIIIEISLIVAIGIAILYMKISSMELKVYVIEETDNNKGTKRIIRVYAEREDAMEFIYRMRHSAEECNRTYAVIDTDLA